MNLRVIEINDALERRYRTRKEFDKTIGEMQSAFMKIFEAS